MMIVCDVDYRKASKAPVLSIYDATVLYYVQNEACY